MNHFDDQRQPEADAQDVSVAYRAAQRDCVVLALDSAAVIEVGGSDRATFLHNLCTNAITGRSTGEGCEAFFTNAKGRILAHVTVHVCEDFIRLHSLAGDSKTLCEHLDKYLITEDVELRDKTDERAVLFVVGPNAAERLAAIGADRLPDQMYGSARTSLDQHEVMITRAPYSTESGYTLDVPRTAAAGIQAKLSDAGCTPAERSVLEPLRIEAGFPIAGIDIGPENLAQESGRTAQAIDFNKGCYLGQEPIARLDALGHTNRELRGLRLETEDVPEAGASIFVPDDEKTIGEVTSSALSYRDGKAVALAMIRRSHLAPGSVVDVQTASGRIPAGVFQSN